MNKKLEIRIIITISHENRFFILISGTVWIIQVDTIFSIAKLWYSFTIYKAIPQIFLCSTLFSFTLLLMLLHLQFHCETILKQQKWSISSCNDNISAAIYRAFKSTHTSTHKIWSKTAVKCILHLYFWDSWCNQRTAQHICAYNLTSNDET